jgi:VWFA-related protein
MRIGNLAGMVFGLAAMAAGVGGRTVDAAQVAGGGAPANQETQPAMQTLQVFSRETVVDVTVTNSKGESLTGLSKADFTILEDGKPQPIRGFTEYGKAIPPVVKAPPVLPPHFYTNLQPAPTTSAVNILLLDALNTGAVDQVFMKQETLRYLKSMPPGTRVAIMGLSSRLRLLQGFTSDPKILEAVVDSKKNRSMPSPFIDTDTNDSLDSMMDMVDDATAASLQEFENEQNAFQTDMRNRMTLEALNQIAAYMAGVKGRKNLIWFTAGMPLQMFPQGGVNDNASMTDYTKDLRKTTDLLTAAQVAVYPVDARGLFNNPANSAANGAARGIASGKGDSMASSNAAFLQKTAGEQLGMEAIAQATGGVAYYNTNGLKEAVGKAIENGANYYSISYVPPNPAFDGAFHSITVKVNRPNVKLAYREGYYADDVAHNQITPGLTLATTAPEPYGNNMAASMGRGVPTSSQILFTVSVDPASDTVNPPEMKVQGVLDPKLQAKPLRRYLFKFSMPGSQVTFTDAPGGMHKAAVEFDLASYDVYGKLITSLSQSVNLPLTTERLQKLQTSPIQVTMGLDLPLGEQFVRLGILDANSDKVGTLEIPLSVTKKAETAAPAAANGGK